MELAGGELGAQLVHYFAEWEQILPPDAREALHAIVERGGWSRA